MVLDTDLLEEEAAAVAESTTIGDMGHERHARDFCTAEVGPTQSVPVRGACTFFFFELVSVDHEGNNVVIVDIVLGFRKALQRLLCFFEAILANEIPRRFRCKVCGEAQWYWPDPLPSISHQHGGSTASADCIDEQTHVAEGLIPAMQMESGNPIALGCQLARLKSER